MALTGDFIDGFTEDCLEDLVTSNELFQTNSLDLDSSKRTKSLNGS